RTSVAANRSLDPPGVPPTTPVPRLLEAAITNTVMAMYSKANQQVLSALQQVISVTLKHWLDENKADVLQAIGSAVGAPKMLPLPANRAQIEEKRQLQFLTTSDLAARWHVHRESVRKWVREGRLPRIHAMRRILVPMSAVTEHEKQTVLT